MTPFSLSEYLKLTIWKEEGPVSGSWLPCYVICGEAEDQGWSVHRRVKLLIMVAGKQRAPCPRTLLSAAFASPEAPAYQKAPSTVRADLPSQLLHTSGSSRASLSQPSGHLR